MNLNYSPWFGLIWHMTNLDSPHCFPQDLWCQFLNIRIPAYRWIHLPALHAPRQSPNLSQNIGIQHLVVDNVGLGALIWAAVVVGAEVDVSFPIFEFLPGQCQRVTEAVTEKTRGGALFCEYTQGRKPVFRANSPKNGPFSIETGTRRRYSKEIEKTWKKVLTSGWVRGNICKSLTRAAAGLASLGYRIGSPRMKEQKKIDKILKKFLTKRKQDGNIDKLRRAACTL